MPKTSKVIAINVQRNLRAQAHIGFTRETVVFITRADAAKNYTTARYTTNDICDGGSISQASVQRAKRAQECLVAALSVEETVSAETLERAQALYRAHEGNIPFADCIVMAI